MYCLTHHGQPISKPHPHRFTCYIEALERGMAFRIGKDIRLFDGVEIIKLIPMLVPIIEPMDLRRRNVYEHPPVNPAKGEYPRYLREPGADRPMTEVIWVDREN